MVLKAVASAVSIGSGFRGGLFFASLFLGALLGKAFAALLAMVTVVQALPAVVCALVGMSGLAVAVVRRAVDHGVSGFGEYRFVADDGCGAGRLRRFGHHGPPHLWLQLRDLALPLARRGDPQRRRCRLDPNPDRWAR